VNDTETVQALIESLRAIGVGASWVTGEEELQDKLSELIRDSPRVYCPRLTESEQALSIPAAVHTLDYASATVAVEEAVAAIAETGSLVCTSSGARPMQGNLLPERHVALVARKNILVGLDELFAALGQAMPSNITLITGPSRTADIEQTLITGVHGPERLDVIIFE
jgi:L-lactate dehydrogenase complex protein LldG